MQCATHVVSVGLNGWELGHVGREAPVNRKIRGTVISSTSELGNIRRQPILGGPANT